MYNLHATGITYISELTILAHSLSQLTYYDIKKWRIWGSHSGGMKSSTVFWDIRLFSPLKVNRRFGGTYHLHLQGHSLPPALTLVSWSAYSPLKMEAIYSSEMSVDFQRTTHHYIPEDGTFYNIKKFCVLQSWHLEQPVYIYVWFKLLHVLRPLLKLDIRWHLYSHMQQIISRM
jgi:hypothetical protein